jgi:hypothetical protein
MLGRSNGGGATATMEADSKKDRNHVQVKVGRHEIVTELVLGDLQLTTQVLNQNSAFIKYVYG